jgi:hypothetical protein
MKQADMNTVLSNGKRQIFLQLSALAGVVAPILFAVVFTLDGLVHRDYSATCVRPLAHCRRRGRMAGFRSPIFFLWAVAPRLRYWLLQLHAASAQTRVGEGWPHSAHHRRGWVHQ